MKPLTVGSLFSGIGGLELGLERAGMRVAWQVEKDEFAQRVLSKHWPHVPKFSDVCEAGAHNLTPVDVICGGFPCQDISFAGKGAGLEGDRSGLWFQFDRIIGELRPRVVLLENVAAILVRGLDRVLGCLTDRGYDAEWEVISACAVGAPHLRKRLFVVAYTDRGSLRGNDPFARDGRSLSKEGAERIVRGVYGSTYLRNERGAATSDHWKAQPCLDRVADGISDRLDRLRCLGNAVVPQVAEHLGREIVDALQG